MIKYGTFCAQIVAYIGNGIYKKWLIVRCDTL